MFKLDFSKSKFIYLICLVFFSILNHAQKSLRIGYVNMDYILENLDDYKTATEEYEIRLNIWKKEISEREVEIENKLKELEIQRPLLTETLYNDFREEIDFGYGLDNANPNDLNPNGWETHFVIGQQF